MNRICIFAHYDRDNIVDKYVFNYLKGLRKVTEHMVFVSTSPINYQDIKALRSLADSVIIRENVGYDFMSWRVGLESVGDISHYDELIVCNDSVYGPLYPLEKVFDKMAKRACDFWGITNHSHAAFHLQSYFIVFRKHMVASKPFRDFWQSIIPEESKARIVQKYEIGLTDGFVKAGFRPATYIEYSPSLLSYLLTVGPPWSFRKCLWLFVVAPLSGVVPRWKKMAPPPRSSFNMIYTYWRQLIRRRKMPFLKIDLLRSNPMGTDIANYEQVLQKYSNYDVHLVKDHLTRIKESRPAVSQSPGSGVVPEERSKGGRTLPAL